MNKVLIANRGEIAVRIAETCAGMGITSVAVYSDADRDALHPRCTDEAFHLGASAIEESYLNAEKLLTIAKQCGADAVHPGYGFLSENAEFAQAVIDAGLIWIGPVPQSIADMGSKIEARRIAMENDVPVVPAVTIEAEDSIDASALAETIGLPLLIKASAGGGGIGMREVHDVSELNGSISQARAQAERTFGSGDLLLEKLVVEGRHVEVQILGDKHGNLVHLYDRDCSAQRRRQKILEEAPAPGLTDELRQSMQAAAIRLAAATGYENAGTVEFLVKDDEFYLLEMNTRLQVEHGVTEAITGIDIVELQIKIAMGEELPFTQENIECTGHAIEARIYAEDPRQQFQPSTGEILDFYVHEQENVRVDSGVDVGSQISHHYDGLLCKFIQHDTDRARATNRLSNTLRGSTLTGLSTNMQLLSAILEASDWVAQLNTTSVETKLTELLDASKASEEDLAILAAVATVWSFMMEPPEADRVYWPGASKLTRTNEWHTQIGDALIHWRWTGADTFSFSESEVEATLIEFDPAAGHLVAEINGQRQDFWITDSGDRLWLTSSLGSLWMDKVYGNSGDSSQSNENECRSHGPGQVLKVLASVGQTVEKGKVLIVLESMKMESGVVAPCAGKLAELMVSEGELIETGQLLAKLEASGGNS